MNVKPKICCSLLAFARCLFLQGRVGDCWFLSAVAVLTEASRISDVMITPEYNEEGIYTVRFCIQVSDYMFHVASKKLHFKGVIGTHSPY